MNGITLIEQERTRQIEKLGYTPEHDAQHAQGTLAQAAAYFAYPGTTWLLGVQLTPEALRAGIRMINGMPYPSSDLFDYADRHTGDEDDENNMNIPGRIRDLAKAGALIAAEIDRLQTLSS